MSRLQAALVSIALLFMTVVYVLAMVPTVENLVIVFLDIGAPGYESDIQTVETIALYVVPAMFIALALLFGYVSMTSRSRFAGQRRW